MLYKYLTVRQFILLPIITIGFIFLISAVKNFGYYKKQYRSMVNSNEIEVLTDNTLSVKDVKITWNTENFHEEITLFENGEDLERTYFELKENYFYVYYKNILVGRFMQFKSESWHGHEYEFLLTKTPRGAIKVTMEADGKDEKIKSLEF